MELQLISIKDYSKKKNITYEAARKQVKKYKDNELKGHIIKQGRTQFLDEFAVEFLNNRRRESPVIVVQMDKDEEIERLENENKALLVKIATLQEELLQEKDQVKLLQEEKIKLLTTTNKKRWFWQK